VYLLRDPDFNPGDRVTTEAVTGTVVLANRDVEKRWTKEATL